MKYSKTQEEELKNKVAQDFFGEFDCTEIIEKIDFIVKSAGKVERYFLWAEAKAEVTDVCAMLTQLVLTIGKARTFDKLTPPPFLGCFDREKIAFVPYHAIQEIFYQNDFNWKVAPSNKTTREFKQVYALIKNILFREPPTMSAQPLVFDFDKDENELKHFIHDNFIVGKTDTTKVLIDKNNFVTIYIKWLETVKPTIQIDWDKAKKGGIIDGDFYLADLLSFENKTLKEKLYVLLKSDHYVLYRGLDESGFRDIRETSFTDKQKAHNRFWAIYERPPLEEYWDYIIERRDLLVPQDIRERKGSFFTPKIWVELSQKYIADVLGKDWQDEYYVWDCAAGTGNLLTGLTNKYNIWASTIDKADVDVMHDRIENGANLLQDHVFQFDFLNDDFSTLPKGLQDIINDPRQRQKLIIYINPPYGECGRADDVGMNNKSGIANTNKTHAKYTKELGKASRELYAIFFARIYNEISHCKIANFAKVKALNAPNFVSFRVMFQAKLEKLFVVSANTFDNVSGQFPIGFFFWDTAKKEQFKHITAAAFDKTGHKIGKKKFFCYDNEKGFINDWIDNYQQQGEVIGALSCKLNDFQNANMVFVGNTKKQLPIGAKGIDITCNNLIPVSIYFAVRKVIPATWINDRDQFLSPNKKWESDTEFQNDCLAYTLFSNNIQSKHGVNHWIPFLEKEVNARDKFDSHFMISFISGKLMQNRYSHLFEQDEETTFIKRKFSAEAKAVFSAGRKLWTYYHSQKKCNVNASLYDIREHFQGRNDKGKMNNTSNDETYNELIANLRSALKTLAKKIEPKVYDYGFLKD